MAIVNRADRRPPSLWLALGPALATLGIVLSLSDGDRDEPLWLPLLLTVCGATVVVAVAVMWWRGRGKPQPPPPRKSTSRWAAGRPEERWH
ncbi:hypothetical protein D0Z06_05940 [Geodermatophilus marinus]|nr:hypothetical protein D0Z06_05940 [Geodermatophilus sp. LHW52908]